MSQLRILMTSLPMVRPTWSSAITTSRRLWWCVIKTYRVCQAKSTRAWRMIVHCMASSPSLMTQHKLRAAKPISLQWPWTLNSLATLELEEARWRAWSSRPNRTTCLLGQTSLVDVDQEIRRQAIHRLHINLVVVQSVPQDLLTKCRNLRVELLLREGIIRYPSSNLGQSLVAKARPIASISRSTHLQTSTPTTLHSRTST